MATIDRKVVKMEFDGSNFEAGVRRTGGLLDTLKQKLGFRGVSDGLKSVGQHLTGLRFGAAQDGVRGLASSFEALRVIGTGALLDIGSRLSQMATSTLKSTFLDPINQGFSEYELKLNSIQTILANTAHKGENLGTVTTYLDELNRYADQTIYNFAEMTKNIGLFTAAGVDLGPATSAIKGLSNVAALSGANSQQAASAMYQMSQAMSSGTIKLMDWNSLVNNNMGGERIQEALKTTARVHGVAIDDMISKNGSFRDSLQEGWLSAEIFTETMTALTGDLSEEQLRQMGYSAEQAKMMYELGQTAKASATDIKTFSQLLSTIGEEVGSGWAESFEIIFGNLEESKQLWTSVGGVIQDFIGRTTDARNAILQTWKDLGGRTALLNGFKNIFTAISRVLAPIGSLMKGLFPPQMGANLASLSKGFEWLTSKLILSAEASENIGKFFEAIGKIIRLVATIVVGAGGLIVSVFKAIWDAIPDWSGIFTAPIGAIGRAVNSMTAWVDSVLASGVVTERLGGIFQTVGGWISAAVDSIRGSAGSLGGSFKALYDQTASGVQGFLQWADVGERVRVVFEWLGSAITKVAAGIAGAVGVFVLGATDLSTGADNLGKVVASGVGNGANEASSRLQAVLNWAQQAKQSLSGVFDWVGRFFANAWKGIASLFGKIGTEIANVDLRYAFERALGYALTIISGKSMLQISQGLGKYFQGIGDAAQGFGQVMNNAASAIQTFQNAARADMILKIAAALALLAASLWVISRIPMAEAGISLGIMAGAMLTATAAMKLASGLDIKGMVAFGVGFGAVSLGLMMMGKAMGSLESVDWNAASIAISIIATLTASLAVIGKTITAQAGQMAAQALVMVGIAYALKQIGEAIAMIGGLDTAAVVKGTTAISVALLGMMGVLRAAQGQAGGAAVLISMALAIHLLGAAVTAFGLLPIPVLIQGGAAVLTFMAGMMAFSAVSKSMTGVAASLIALGIAINLLVPPLIALGLLPIPVLVQGLIAVGAALTMFALAVTAMSGSFAGAAAIIAISVALNLLVPPIITLGLTPISVLATGLIAIAAALGLLAGAALLLAPAVPPLLGLAGAIALLGAGAAAAGLGMLAFSAGLATMVALGSAGILVLGQAITAFVAMLPQIAKGLALALVDFIRVIGDYSPEIFEAFTKMLKGLIKTATDILPDLERFLRSLLDKLIRLLIDYIPKLADGAMKMAIAIVDRFAQNIGPLADKGTDAIVNLLDAIGRNTPRIVDAIVRLAKTIIKTLVDTLLGGLGELGKAALDIGKNIVDGIGKGIGSVGNVIKDKLMNMARDAWSSVKGFLGIQSPSRLMAYAGEMIMLGMEQGLERNTKRPVDKMREAVEKIADEVDGVDDWNPVIKPVLDFSGLRDVRGQITGLLPENLAMPYWFQHSQNPSQARLSALEDALAQLAEKPSVNVNYNQSITSPKPIDEGLVYRETNSLTARLRRDLVASRI